MERLLIAAVFMTCTHESGMKGSSLLAIKSNAPTEDAFYSVVDSLEKETAETIKNGFEAEVHYFDNEEEATETYYTKMNEGADFNDKLMETKVEAVFN